MKDILVILGPTASGKTRLATHVAKKLNAEIISADSRQVYQFMDIGTGKDLNEYTIDGVEIPYHIINNQLPGYRYNVAEFQLDFQRIFQEINVRNKLAILCGGSGLYIESALRGNTYLGIDSNPEFYKSFDTKSEEEIEIELKKISSQVQLNLAADTKQRKLRAIEIGNYILKNPDWKPRQVLDLNEIIIGTDISRELRREKITKRLSERLNNGLIEEVKFLLENYLTYDDLEYYGLEYKWVGNYLKKEISKKELFDGLNIAIHQFAKRQMTWFRKMESSGYKIKWVNVEQPLQQQVEQVIAYYQENKKGS